MDGECISELETYSERVDYGRRGGLRSPEQVPKRSQMNVWNTCVNIEGRNLCCRWNLGAAARKK
jgi:hypothetical protein